MADDDPIRGDERGLGHLYILAQPEIAAEEILVELLGRANVIAVMQETIRQIVHERGSSLPPFEPDVYGLVYRMTRAEGAGADLLQCRRGPPLGAEPAGVGDP